ncbi:ABC transporter substrate-binding protein [Crateriforma spongiae]|uniref:ABC transporter substrate-binding protein n=1 Tax=Crateriforma spongiae TaxID=2724528 RepID=UPI0014475A06|nr:ABC transporter substrate-binding protein [Crateriforma spongiae]
MALSIHSNRWTTFALLIASAWIASIAQAPRAQSIHDSIASRTSNVRVDPVGTDLPESITTESHSFQRDPTSDSVNTQDRITIHVGTSTSMTGPCADLGNSVLDGIRASFHQANAEGKRYRFQITAMDDAYDPAKTASNTKRLLADPTILAVIGNVGTPTGVVAATMCCHTDTLFFAPISGAQILRTEGTQTLQHFRGSYEDEVLASINAILRCSDIPADQIGFFCLRDGLGMAGFKAACRVLEQHGGIPAHRIPVGLYARDSLAIQNGLADLLNHQRPPKAIIVGASTDATKEFVSHARRHGYRGWIICISFVQTDSLARVIAVDDRRVIATQVVPDPLSNHDIAIRYRDALKDFAPQSHPNPASFEGYLLGSAWVHAVDSLEVHPNRKSVVQAVENIFTGTTPVPWLEEFRSLQNADGKRIWATRLTSSGVQYETWDQIFASEAL